LLHRATQSLLDTQSLQSLPAPKSAPNAATTPGTGAAKRPGTPTRRWSSRG